MFGRMRTYDSGQTGMCGGVSGVSAGGIVSSCYCLMYKLYTLKVTKKQVSFFNFNDEQRINCLKCILEIFVDTSVNFSTLSGVCLD